LAWVLPRRIIGNRDIGRAPGACLAARNDGALERRAGGLDRDDRLDQRRPRVGDQPTERARLRVGEHHRRADPVQEGWTRVPLAPLRLFGGDDGLDLGSIERIEDRIALLALVRPLALPLRLLICLQAGSVTRNRREL